MVSSLDGFIAKKDGNISWMKPKDNYENGITLSEETNYTRKYKRGQKKYQRKKD